MAKLNSVFDATTTWALQRGIELQSDPQTGSTNDNAKSNANQETADLRLYLTSHQLTGRGRGSHHWLDTGAGESLLCTWSWSLPSPPQSITAPRIGLALFLACRGSWPSLSWALKAPNDLILNGAKMAGLLIESVSTGDQHRILIGLGMNVLNHPRALPEATHLGEDLGDRPEEGEWFQFMDELKDQLQVALSEVTLSHLSAQARAELVTALNAHPNRPFHVQSVSAAGDIHHDRGVVRWVDL